jgi:hypothetical protein
MQMKGIVPLTIIALSIVLSGCVFWDTPPLKVPPTVDNATINQLNIELKKMNVDNVSVINSSTNVWFLNFHQDTNTTYETIRFNTTDGKTHTSNLTIDYNTNTIHILDIDDLNIN